MIEELARKDGITREQFVSESGDINADLFEVLDKYHPSVGIWGMIVMLATMSCRYDARLSDVLDEVKSAYFLETEKMFWNYRVIDFAEENNGEPCLKICEVYYDDDEKPTGYADASVMGDNLAETRQELKRMTAATNKPVLTLKNGKLI